MGCEAGRCNKTSTPKGIFIVIPSLEGWPTKAKEAPSPHEVRLTPLDTNPVFQYLGDNLAMSTSNRVERKNYVVKGKTFLCLGFWNLTPSGKWFSYYH